MTMANVNLQATSVMELMTVETTVMRRDVVSSREIILEPCSFKYCNFIGQNAGSIFHIEPPTAGSKPVIHLVYGIYNPRALSSTLAGLGMLQPRALGFINTIYPWTWRITII